MSSSEEGQPIASEGASLQRQKTRRVKVLLGTLAVLCVAAALAACAASLTKRGEENSMDTDDMQSRGDLLSMEEEDVRVLRDTEGEADGGPTRGPRAVTNPSRQQPHPSCSSDSTADTIPAAHIKGVQNKWTENTNVAEYNTQWQCSEYENINSNRHHPRVHAYVDGGMWFEQSDKSLYVPTCGYYYIYSQILFKVSEAYPVSVYHQLHINRNCSLQQPDDHTYTVTGRASIPASPHNLTLATTFTGDIVKLCGGGRVWVKIPAGADRVPCCPHGDLGGGSFFGAVLISETNCHWPPRETMEM